MDILMACEFSGIVRDAFKAKGHNAISCDILPTEKPGLHFELPVQLVLGLHWDMIIAFPDCTFLTVANTYMKRGCSKYTAAQAAEYRKQAVEFFMLFANHPCKLKVIENPIGVMTTIYRKPDQVIQPNKFGENASKQTCLWLYGLPPLIETEIIEPKIINGKKIWGNQTPSGQNKLGPSPDRAKDRSRTYPGIAAAMADQWG